MPSLPNFVSFLAILPLFAPFTSLAQHHLSSTILVNDSLSLDQLIHQLLPPHNPFGASHLYAEILATVDHSRFSGFLLVVSNGMRIERDSCALFGDIFSVEFNHRWVPLACSHYMVRYEPAPLRIRFSPAILVNLTHLVKIVLTTVRFSCPLFHGQLRQCPNHPLFCIPRRLFCDSVDNCGMGADEMNCTKYEMEEPDALSTSPSTSHPQNVQQRASLSASILALIQFHPLLTICLLATSIAALAALLWTKNCRKSSTTRLGDQQKVSICPKIEVTSSEGVAENGGGTTLTIVEEATADPTMPKKRSVVHKFISSFRSATRSGDASALNEADEAIALLSLGLRNVLYSLPIDPHNNSGNNIGAMMDDGEAENGRIPARMCQYGSSTSSSASSFDSLLSMFRDEQ